MRKNNEHISQIILDRGVACAIILLLIALLTERYMISIVAYGIILSVAVVRLIYIIKLEKRDRIDFRKLVWPIILLLISIIRISSILAVLVHV